MADYKILLGTQLDTSDIVTQINEAERKIDPIKIKVGAETKELTKSIQDALKSLSNGTNNTLTLDTSKFEGSIVDVKNAVIDLKRTLSSLDDSTNMKDLLSSVNQIANAIGKVTDESETLSKSLSALSKKDFGFNFNLKTGNANPLKAATDYGQAASRKAIPAIKEQINYLKDVINVTMDADKALQRYLMKQHKGYAGMQLKNSLEKQVLSGYDLNGEKVSKSDRMVAGEELIGYYKEIAALNNISLDGFNSKFSKSATEIVDDTTKIQTGVKQTEEAVESAVSKMKQMFGGGIGAEQLSTQLKPIVDDLHSIQEAITALSKDTSLGGLTASFNRLSESIENLLANAEKVKGVLNSGFDTNVIGDDINSIKSPKSTRRRTQSEADEYLNGYLKHWNIKGENAKTVKAKFKAFSDVSSLGAGNKAYDAALDDLMSTLRQLGKVYKDANAEAQRILNILKGSKIKAPKDIYGAEFGDDWANIKHKHKMLRNEGVDVDSKYMELSDPKNGMSSYFPGDILNEADQLRRIIDVYDEVNKKSKGGFVDLDDEYDRNGLRDRILDIVSVMQEQVEAEQKVTQTSTQSTNTISQNENQKQQKYEETKQKLDEVNRAVAEHKEVIENPNKLTSLGDNALSYMDEYDDLVRQQKEIESALKDAEQQAKQTANSYEKISRSTSLVGNDDSFQKTFEASNQAAQEAQKHFQELLADEKAVVSVTEQFDDNNALQSFVVNIKRATGEVETLRYAMDKLNDEGDEGFAYQGGSSSDSRVEKQLEARIKKANDLQIKLDKIKTDYENMGANKPIKEKAHIESLSEQYDKVQAAIESVKKADESTYVSMVSNAEKEKAALESLVKVYRSAETFSTDLRAKDRDTAKEIYSSRLNVLSSKMKKDGVYDGLSSDVVALSGKITKASDVSALSEIANELAKLDAKYKSAKAAKDEFNRSQNVGSSVSGLRSEIEILQNASPSIKSFKTEINGAEVSIESLLKDLDRVSTKGDFDVVEGKVKAFSKAAEAAGIDLNEVKTEAKKANDAYKQMLDIQKEIRSLSIKEKNLTELGNTSELNEVSTKLKTLKSDYETLKRTFGGKLTSAQFGNLQAEIDETEAELKQLDAKFADIKAKLANDIKIKISDTGFNGFEQEVLRACNAAEELEGVYPDLEAALNRLDIAMEDVYSADQSGDVKRLVAANEEYENSLKQVYSQLKLYQQAEQKAYKNELLTQKKASLSSEMEIWLKDNTRAAKEFGDEIRRLQASLDGLDDKGVKLVGQQFKSIKKQAQAMGKTGLTVFDKLKSKVKEYAGYLSAAELFMYAEQGLRSMFEAVKEIDTAMTGLYRVTDLTASQYDTLFNEMISSAKEYGATLNDIINATTDWVRAGFDADTALGLAEVTTMYQHISDLDYDTAAENLITAYNGFKDELNGVFDGDTVGAVNYIADILNELDRHNCPLVV